MLYNITIERIAFIVKLNILRVCASLRSLDHMHDPVKGRKSNEFLKVPVLTGIQSGNAGTLFFLLGGLKNAV